jgi:hypothetical protein
MSKNHAQALIWANSIVRLAMIRKHAHLSFNDECLEVNIFKAPQCRCCSKNLDPNEWFRSMARGYEKELECLIRHETSIH